MSGEDLRTKLATLDVTQTEIARRIGMSQQSFNQGLNVADVKSGLLEKIAEALSLPMSFFYPDATGVVNNNNIKSQKAHNISNGSGNISESNNSNDQETIKKLLDQNSQLIEILKSKV